METITQKYVKQLLKKRARNTHKGNYGRVLIIAGSPGMAGAAALSATAALRSGAGLVSVSIDERLFPIVQTCVPCATCAERMKSLDTLERWDAAVIGPGIGTDADAEKTVSYVLDAYAGPLILDADALNIVSAWGSDARFSKPNIILTPHSGEAARLLGVKTSDVDADRKGTVAALTERFGGVAVLKGNETLVASPGEDVYVNPTGNPGMATGGSGDVLSGVIASFAGQGFSILDAALAGVYIHGLAGDIGAEEIGEYGLIASDIANALPRAIQSVCQS
jgi:NAD(P)H-hydrate epimerase